MLGAAIVPCAGGCALPTVSPPRHQSCTLQAPPLQGPALGPRPQLRQWRWPAAAGTQRRSAAAAPFRHRPSSRGRKQAQARGRRGGCPSALFTGIVQGKATVRSVRKQGDFSSLSISFPPGAADGVQIGASVSINGTCLTVTNISGGKEGRERTLLGFDVISETLRATNLGSLGMNSAVNFERSARMGDEIGGHHVSGHVHTTAQLQAVEAADANNRKLTFEIPSQWTKYLLSKGFVAVDGCSLTVGEVGPDTFSVYLIPETLRATVLGERSVGDAVNVEIDAQTQAIVDTVETVVERYLADNPPGLLTKIASALPGGSGG